MEDLGKKIKTAIAYVKQQNLNSLQIGKYAILDDSFFMIQEYMTRKEEECKVESHLKYIDVQCILKGKEKIKVFPVDKLDEIIPYDKETDVVFWKPVPNMMEVALSEGGYVVLYPTDAHQPGIAVDEPEVIRKVVIKVKV